MMMYITPSWPAPSNVKAYTTTKNGWISKKQDEHGVALQTLLNMPSQPIWLNQKHTTEAVEAKPENRGVIADAVYTSERDRVCTVLTADCIPVLVCDKRGTKIAAIHAGWRGLAAGVIENTLKKLNLAPEDTLVWLGPAIGPAKFEVGQDVFDAFTVDHPEAVSAFIPHTKGKWFGNLYTLAKQRLHALNIQHIYGGDFCTYTQEDIFFSFRRDKNHLGRIASVIWLDK